MKINMHQTYFESIEISPNEDWYNSNSYESIQPNSESFYDTIHWYLNRFTVMLVMKILNRFKHHKGGLWHTNTTQDMKGSHDTMRHGCEVL